MPYDYKQLDSISRLLVEAELLVPGFGGGRFQPTNFPDLGAALYRGADGKQWLLVESAQSMANRMERVCWLDGDSETDRVGRYNDACHGIPCVLAVDTDGNPLTASPLEAHRLASPYLWEAFVQTDGKHKDKSLGEMLKDKFTLSEHRLVPWKKVASGLLEVDPACLLHGIWFSDADFVGGKVRLTRALSGFIEASDPSTANFGFQKRDAVSDRTDKDAGQTAVEGFGSVIGPKQHFTSAKIKACFQLDLDRLRGYGLPPEAVHALAAWAIYKMRRVLADGRDGVGGLRTECKFACIAIEAIAYDSETGQKKIEFTLPELGPDLVAQFRPLKFLKQTDGKEEPDDAKAVIKVRWVPKIEGKAELKGGLTDKSVNLAGLGGKARVEQEKPKKPKKGEQKVEPRTFLMIFGEWRQFDKQKLRDQNTEPDVLKIVDAAIKDYEKKWTDKLQGKKAKPEEEDVNAENPVV